MKATRDIRSLSPSTSLMETVKRYEPHGVVTIDFLARALGKKRSEIQEDLKSLQEAGLVEIAEGERVFTLSVGSIWTGSAQHSIS